MNVFMLNILWMDKWILMEFCITSGNHLRAIVIPTNIYLLICKKQVCWDFFMHN